jgi:hypothetical protein
MAATSERQLMARFPQIKGDGVWSARDGQFAVLAAVLIVFVVAASLSDGKLVPDFISGGAPGLVAAGNPTDDDLKTGSILITPSEGNLCEHRLIDNKTWRIRSNGVIPCDEAVSWAAQQTHPNPSARIEAIRDGFFTRR